MPNPNAPAPSGRATSSRQGSRTLVIGCGFIGSHVVMELAADGRPPVVLTRSCPTEEVALALDAEDLRLGDAADPGTLKSALESIGHVVYCAGGLLPAASERAPELSAKLTLSPLRAVLAALRTRPEVALTYISSGGTVYGEPDRVPVGEDEPTRPLASYGKLHLACEDEIGRSRHDHGLRASILRCSTVYGEYQRPDRGQGAVVTFLHRIEHGMPIDLYGGGTTVRDYVYAGDVAQVLVALLDREDAPPILNVGAGLGTSLIELLHLVEKQVGRPAKVVPHPERDFDIHRIVLDTSQLRDLMGFEATPLETGIAHTHAWLSARVRGVA